MAGLDMEKVSLLWRGLPGHGFEDAEADEKGEAEREEHGPGI
jgi:hypothetical protein